MFWFFRFGFIVIAAELPSSGIFNNTPAGDVADFVGSPIEPHTRQLEVPVLKLAMLGSERRYPLDSVGC